MASTAESVIVRNRWDNAVQFVAEVEVTPDMTARVKSGLVVRWARKNGADLSGADLRCADLRDADLSAADLRDADLSGADLRDAVLSCADLRDADLRGAVLRGADLSAADLRGADLRDADLRGADLSDADLSGAVLRGADLSCADWIPKIENIHQRIFDAASAEGALYMGSWHHGGDCGTTHCRAGWAVVLAGPGGRVLEGVYGTGTAAALIYQASDPKLERIPNWIDSNEGALADMKRLAENPA
jgi:hypothetical protein